ncbi:uncharacterized protein LOC126818295 [Patella vulgata]|uniref:uncharacterized protein LOC126818295 n=1 Tax=Patella vulgata TaxID=6465 RepID=UPI00218096E5|nr:uncharacterized protein LOC126818295 [Patella vulgata]
MGEKRLIFGKLSVVGGENIILTLLKTIDDDFNTIYGCTITFGDGLTGYNATKLIFTQDVRPRINVPGNQQIYGRIGHRITLVFTYHYSFPAFSINFTRTNSSGFKSESREVNWKDVIDDDRRIFQNSSILGGGQISLIILNTTIQDYNAVYKCEVIFTNGKIVSAMIELILQSDTVMPETEKTTFERNLMIALVIVMVLISLIIGIVVCRYKCRSHKYERPRRASNTTNNMRHSYISLNSVVIFHANRDSTTTNAESTASNDTDAYANPYDPINRDGIDTSKNVYMPLQNPGTSSINQGEDVQETNGDDTSVTNINDVETADDDDGDDDTSTHDFNPYNALNKYTLNSDIHSYISLPPCTRSDNGEHALSPNSSRGEDVMFVKKRPSMI